MDFSVDVAVILKALCFAAGKHRNQRRKDEDASPYINHPIEVADILWRVGGVRDQVTIIGALLHDTIEDTDTTREEIRAEFGEDVLSIVLEVSDDKSLPKRERKRLQIVHASSLSDGAKTIKLADKICNVNDIMHSPPHHWSLERRREYLEWTRAVVAGLRGVNAALERRCDDILAEAFGTLA